MTLFKALTGGAFDRLNWQHSGEFDQNFSKKSNARGFAIGGFGIDRYIRVYKTRVTVKNSFTAPPKNKKKTFFFPAIKTTNTS